MLCLILNVYLMNLTSAHNKWYLVEGNIGSGKTTLLEKLNQNENFEVIREPVNLWLSIKGSDGKNLLQEFYEEPVRYSYLFQTMVFKTRLESIDTPQLKPFRFSERSIWTDRYVFGKSCINSRKMNTLETNCYHFWFDWLENKFFKKPDGIIYLRTSPEKCFERMHERARNEESSVPLEYLQELHNYHEEWFNNWKETPVLVINNNLDNNWDGMLDQVNNFINTNNKNNNLSNICVNY
jgi:thymidine kinase